MLKKILVSIYTFFQIKFVYKFRKIGKNARLGKNLFIFPHRVSLGHNVYIGQNSYLDGDIEVGNNVLFASYVAIVGGDHRYDMPGVPIRDTGREHWKKTIISDDCWLGHGCIIMNGVTIGPGSIIGAGSVVTKNIPENVIAVGNPARVLRKRF